MCIRDRVKADAIITHLSKIPIGIFTADCIPILICDPRLQVAAAIHAGRKGTCQSIVNKTIMTMKFMVTVYVHSKKIKLQKYLSAIVVLLVDFFLDCYRLILVDFIYMEIRQ